MGLNVVCVGLTSAAEACVVMAGPKIGLKTDGVGFVVLLADCADDVGVDGAEVVGAEAMKPNRLPPPRLSVVDEDGKG